MKTPQINDAVAPSDLPRAARVADLDLLDREADRAYRKVCDGLQAVTHRLNPATTIRSVVLRHPCRTVAWASALGFCAGVALSLGRQFRSRSVRLSDRTVSNDATDSSKSNSVSVTPPWWLALVGPSLEVARVFGERWITRAITGKRDGADEPGTAS
jgi:hypothetical protein